jgi:hypothetical protein
MILWCCVYSTASDGLIADGLCRPLHRPILRHFRLRLGLLRKRLARTAQCRPRYRVLPLVSALDHHSWPGRRSDTIRTLERVDNLSFGSRLPGPGIRCLFCGDCRAAQRAFAQAARDDPKRRSPMPRQEAHAMIWKAADARYRRLLAYDPPIAYQCLTRTVLLITSPPRPDLDPGYHTLA